MRASSMTMAMSMSLFLGRIHCLRPSLPLTRTKLSSSNSPSQASLPNPTFAIGEYLVESCGLTSDEALKASKLINHLKSPDKPDAVLQFLREIGISEADLRSAISHDPRILCSSVEKNMRPNIDKLLEVGISVEDISGIISVSPVILNFNIVPKIDFWLGILESVENLQLVLKAQGGLLLSRKLESILIPNLSYLKDHCGFSRRQIVRLIKSNPRVIAYAPEALQKQIERAKGLGIDQSSGTFLHALIIVSYLNQGIIDARINKLTSLGLSQEEVKHMISKFPFLLNISEELVARKFEFLTNDVGYDKSQFVSYPNLLAYSMENRLVPRSLVWKLLMSKGLMKSSFSSFVMPGEQQFLEKFVLPNEDAIPGLYQKYVDAKKNLGN